MAESNLSQDIFIKLSDRILHWEYSPGQRLTEELLCEEFNVSRSPVREALQMLAERNLVDKRPRHGYRVKQLNLTEIHELYEVRTALEAHVMERICEDGLDEDLLGKLEAQWQGFLDDLPGMGNYPADLDEEFHQIFVQAVRNRTLQMMLKDIDDRIHFVRTIDITSPERMRETCLEHLGILDAVRRHDAAKAVAILKRNIQGGRASVESALKEALARAYELHG